MISYRRFYFWGGGGGGGGWKERYWNGEVAHVSLDDINTEISYPTMPTLQMINILLHDWEGNMGKYFI